MLNLSRARAVPASDLGRALAELIRASSAGRPAELSADQSAALVAWCRTSNPRAWALELGRLSWRP